jgi:hypothetical protein
VQDDDRRLLTAILSGEPDRFAEPVERRGAGALLAPIGANQGSHIRSWSLDSATLATSLRVAASGSTT